MGICHLRVLNFLRDEAPTLCFRTQPRYVAKNFYAIFVRLL